MYDLESLAHVAIPGAAAVGLGLAALYTYHTSQISIKPSPHDTMKTYDREDQVDHAAVAQKLEDISSAIEEGAVSFLKAEYKYISAFMTVFALLMCIPGFLENGVYAGVAFFVGGLTSLTCGYIGMRIAVYANVRTAKQATIGIGEAFVCAVKAGCVMGFALVSIGLLVLYALILVYRNHFQEDHQAMFEVVAGYGLGGSAIALFGRVGGGIYTKAADVGADLVGKVEQGIPEDDPRNPAVIADNVGDNVGDIAGMGADLFGSFAESTCAALVIASYSQELCSNWGSIVFPLVLSAAGILVCFVTQFFATTFFVIDKIEDIQKSLKNQLLISTVLMTPVAVFVCWLYLPATFVFEIKTGSETGDVIRITAKWWYSAVCILMGLWSGLFIGLVTEYYTSHSYKPVRDVAHACQTGAATNIIYGLALGYQSNIIPVVCLAATIYVCHMLAGMYGIALGALGMLSTLSIGLTIDAYGPISDNAGGIAEMAGLGEDVRKRTDALDAAGNTTAAIGKGFAIGSAALVSLALFGAFVTRSEIGLVNLMSPLVFAGLLFGSMLPYAFSALTMKSVGLAALAMVAEVRRQFHEIRGLMDGTAKPDYARCVSISTDASLREMMLPGAQVIFTPLIVGFVFGKTALAGVLAGALVSGVQMAISMSNTGGAWDNAKKFIESGQLGGKHSASHAAAVIGDTVGDPMKDTSGPSLNILIKLMAIISLVFAGAIDKYGGFLWKWL
mmetsp:Transcript_21521/g.36910  ORF Transcript_21521/g.36910 Transcript_21521/m.36910 type:complete len:731 (-) Transcript_21521:671-2863(-)